MKKIAGVPLIIIGGAMILLALLIGTEDDGLYARVPQPNFSTLLIVIPLMFAGVYVMAFGAGLLLSNTGVGQPGEKATSARQPAAATAMLPPFENSIGMLFKVLPAGSFVMGSPKSDYGQYNDSTQRTMTIASSFFIGVHQVTQSQYEAVMGDNPSCSKGANNPVEMVSCDEANAFCKKLSALPAERAAGREYRLPTDAEWEYACRAGTTTRYCFGDDARNLGNYAWFEDNSGYSTHAVGEKLPNSWGLYDMHGNVFEWCFEAHQGFNRFCRGGSRSSKAMKCQATSYGMYSPTDCSPNFGFRVALNSPFGQSPEV